MSDTALTPTAPRAMPLVHTSIVSMLDHTTREWGQQLAVVCGDQSLTYAELRSCVAALARWLIDAGASRQRVATVLPNGLLACIAPYAIAAAGAQQVPLNAQYTARELAYMLGDAAPGLVLVDDSMLDKVSPLVESLAGCTVMTSYQVLQRLSGWRSVRQNNTLEAFYPAPAAMAILQYTGGSSGFPKGVHLSHRAIAINVSQREGLLPVRRGTERVLCVMPLFHSYAMAMGLFLCGYSGSTLVVLPGYHPERVLEAISTHRITIFPGSPTMFTGLMACPQFATSDWRSVHTCYSGSAALQAETLRRWQEATGAPIFEGYGQTEAGPVLTFNPASGPVKIASVGVVVPHTEVEVVDLDTGLRVLPVGEKGEIRARGPQVMDGYHGLPSETAESLRGDWLYTGDIGEFDADGYLFIRDRKKDLVIVSGYNVYPREVEEVLFTHPDVLDAAVVGQPDAYRGEVLRAFVVLREGAIFDIPNMLDFCNLGLARYKVPSHWEQLPALPKTSVNKTDKKALKEWARKQADASTS
jgi:long-chain acyl-CoA synthetase